MIKILKKYFLPTFALWRWSPSALLCAENFLMLFGGCKTESIITLETGHARVGNIRCRNGKSIGNLGNGGAINS
jgi:hypothetical protein